MIERLPGIFIGSSSEGLDVAYGLQECLEYDAEPTVWSQSVFTPSQATLSDLVKESHRTDFAIFVVTPDDVRIMRGAERSVPRDNVIFELGLFIGALSVERCFFVMPRLSESFVLPSDLLGITPLTYVADRSDGRLVAALGPAVNKIRVALRRLGPRPVPHYRTTDSAPSPSDRTDYFIEHWNTPEILQARQVLQEGLPMHASEDEDGSATKALQVIFAFLESLADSLLNGDVDESRARPVFEGPVKSVWGHAYAYLAPLHLADEWWEPEPRIAELAQRWKKG